MSAARASRSTAARAVDAAQLDRTLAALADPARRHVVELLSRGPQRAGELARQLDVSPATMSKHLRVLRTSGLVRESSDDVDLRVRIYALESAPMTELRAWINAAEREWVKQLRSFAAHVERKSRAR